MPMVPLEVRDLPGNTPVISLMLEGCSNGAFGHIKAELIADLAQGRVTLFSCCSYEMSFVGRRKLRWTPTAWSIFCRTSDFVLVPDLSYGVFVHTSAKHDFGS